MPPKAAEVTINSPERSILRTSAFAGRSFFKKGMPAATYF
jgi:hypothetical protein